MTRVLLLAVAFAFGTSALPAHASDATSIRSSSLCKKHKKKRGKKKAASPAKSPASNI
jgi:hypothetical protein